MREVMTEEKIWYAVFGLAVNIAMFVIPLVMLLDLRRTIKEVLK